MLIKTKGIVIRTIKYSETSVIADIFTEEKGLLSYIISGVRKSRSKTQASMLMPLSIVEMVAYHSDRVKLHRVRELKPAYVFSSIPFEVRKATICLFLSELCLKTMKGTDASPSLFHFLETQIIRLDQEQEHFLNWHLFFMIGFAEQLGFAFEPPAIPGSTYFDLLHGKFLNEKPDHAYWTADAEGLTHLINKEFTHPYTRQERNTLVDDLLTFFRLHIENMRELNSHRVLRQVL
jgi:DNA repair protein RecO (recombination protein O)